MVGYSLIASRVRNITLVENEKHNKNLNNKKISQLVEEYKEYIESVCDEMYLDKKGIEEKLFGTPKTIVHRDRIFNSYMDMREPIYQAFQKKYDAKANGDQMKQYHNIFLNESLDLIRNVQGVNNLHEQQLRSLIYYGISFAARAMRRYGVYVADVQIQNRIEKDTIVRLFEYIFFLNLYVNNVEEFDSENRFRYSNFTIDVVERLSNCYTMDSLEDMNKRFNFLTINRDFCVKSLKYLNTQVSSGLKEKEKKAQSYLEGRIEHYNKTLKELSQAIKLKLEQRNKEIVTS